MRDALDTTHEITKLIKKLPCRDAIFKRLKEEMASDSPGIHVLCLTRWTVKAEALKSILDKMFFWSFGMNHWRLSGKLK